MKEKVKLIILIIVFVVLLIFVNNILKGTENPKNDIGVENILVNENITTTTVASYNENNAFDSNKENEVESVPKESALHAYIEVTEENFEEEVLKSDKRVLIDFYADWCNPCKILSPIVEEVAIENPNIKVVKIDVDSNEKLAYEYRTYSIPTLVVIENGVEVNRAVGAIPKEDVLELIK